MPEQILHDPLHGCAARIDAAIGNVFDRLHSLADAVGALWAQRQARGERPGGRDLARLRPAIDALMLGGSSFIEGAGMVLEPGELKDHDLFIEWWRLVDGQKTVKLKLDFNRNSDSFYNYLDMPWFDRPRHTGRRAAGGPYVDIYGSDLYVLTLALPVTVGGRFIGVVGADLPLHRFERVLLGNLMRLPRDTLLVSAEGRVIAANTARWMEGEMAGRLAEEPDCEQVAVGTGETALGWSLLCLPERRQRAAA